MINHDNIDLTAAVTEQTGFAHLDDLPCVKLQFGQATAVIALYGAQVLSYQPRNNQEILWLSPLATWHNQTPIRGGVPICWPWFGAISPILNPERLALPNHGLVRTQLWQLKAKHCSAESVSVTLEITIAYQPWFGKKTNTAAKIVLQLQLTLAKQLQINLRCNDVIVQQAALHSYFKIEDISKAQVQPLPLTYIDTTCAQVVTSKANTATFCTEVDRIYQHSGPMLKIQNSNLSVGIEQIGHDATVIWNPWRERSAKMTDLTEQSYKEFICVETAKLALDTAAPLNLTQHITLL